MRHRRRRHDPQLTNMKHRTPPGWEGYVAPDRRTENPSWEMFSHPSAKPRPPPPLALPDLNAAPAPDKGPRLGLRLRPHQPLAQHSRHILDGQGRATATEEG